MRDAVPSPFTRDLTDELRRFRVVLVEPKYAGNLGLVARAMASAGFGDLRLVRPRAPIDLEARTLAMAGRPILDACQRHDDLASALEGSDLALAVSRFGGRHRPNPLTPASAARVLLEQLPQTRAAIVFGSEDQGLSRDECATAWAYLSIPTGGSPSLNLALAVAVVLHAFAAEAVRRVPEGRERRDERAHLASRLLALFGRIGFVADADPGHMRPKLLAALARLELDPREVRILHGLVGQIESHLAPHGSEAAP
ncbi:MAG: TrmH family RNA methyltransferase [bacterium]